MRAALAMLCVACGGDPPLTQDHYVDLDVVLETWTDCLADLDRRTAGKTQALQPQAPSPARDSVLLAALRTRLAEQASALRTELPLVPDWGPDGSLDLHADRDGDRAVGPEEPLVASVFLDAANRRVLAVDEEHPALRRALPLAPSLGLASAYTYGRMHAAKATAAADPGPAAPVALQPPGYHASLPAL